VRSKHLRLHVDDLEDRSCPSTIQVIGHTLFVVGDAGDNRVLIQDNGNGQVRASIDSPIDAAPLRTGTSSIVVLGRDGNDIVDYSLLSSLTQPMAVAVFGGGGDDAIDIRANADIAASGGLGLYLDGGLGNDRISVAYEGVLTGALAAVLKGGDGDDTLTANVALSGGSTGYLAAALFGDAGDDGLTLKVTADTDKLSALVVPFAEASVGDKF